MTVLETIQRSTGFLEKKGVESPRLQAELILAHVLKLPRMRLYLDFERVLSEPQKELCREMVVRRGRREPLQHILGSTNFCGLEIEVGPQALVPRPETEQLAEFGWKFLEDCGETPKALDFGTGTGCIAIALAVKCPRAEIWGLDTSSSALALAKRNADRHQVGEKVHFLEASTLDLADPGLRFDLVISNPPYINSSEIGQLQPEVKDFDPLLALDGGADGLDYYRLLATQAGQVLACGGRFMAEFGDGQAEAIRAIFQSQNWIVENIVEDYTRRQRFLIARRE